MAAALAALSASSSWSHCSNSALSCSVGGTVFLNDRLVCALAGTGGHHQEY